jgi:hypothetical protein
MCSGAKDLGKLAVKSEIADIFGIDGMEGIVRWGIVGIDTVGRFERLGKRYESLSVMGVVPGVNGVTSGLSCGVPDIEGEEVGSTAKAG